MKGTYVVGRDWIFITRAILRQIASAVSMQPRYSHLGPDSSPIPMIIVTRITMSPTPLSARRRVPIDSCRVIEGRSTTIKRTSVRENPADGIGTRGTWMDSCFCIAAPTFHRVGQSDKFENADF